MGSLTLPTHGVVYFDTSAVIYSVEKIAPYDGLLLPAEAAQLLREEPNAVLVDVRSRAEWDFVGRIPGAVEIEWKSYPGMQPNAQFQDQLAARVKKDALVMFVLLAVAAKADVLVTWAQSAL